MKVLKYRSAIKKIADYLMGNNHVSAVIRGGGQNCFHQRTCRLIISLYLTDAKGTPNYSF